MTHNVSTLPSFEVLQVANGFMIRPPLSFNSDTRCTSAEVHVFPTWAEASKWLGDQFRSASEAA